MAKTNGELEKMLRQAEQEHKSFIASKEALRIAWFDPSSRKIFMEFNSGVQVGIPVEMEPELKNLSNDALKKVTIDQLRETLIWEDFDIYMAALGTAFKALNGPEFEKYISSYLGKKRGQVKSEAKAKAVRENGKKGGRPINRNHPAQNVTVHS